MVLSFPGDRRLGVVWHTQGSGKSLTMAFYAGRIIRERAMANPNVVVLTDRNDLDDQLFGTFARCHELLRQPPVQAASGRTCAPNARCAAQRLVHRLHRTPIELQDANTRAVFGDYISVYDIQRAVEDRATVPIYYERRLAKLTLDERERPTIDPGFEEATEGEEVDRKEKLKPSGRSSKRSSGRTPRDGSRWS